MKEILYNKSFRLMAFGTFISNIGDQMYNIALTLSLYTVTGDIRAIAYMWLFRALFRIPIQVLAGVISDRFNKKKIIVTTNFISGCLAITFIFLDMSKFVMPFMVILLLQLLNDVESNASSSIISYIVEKDHLMDANSSFSVLNTVSMFLAPGLAGIIYMTFDIEFLYVLNSMSFFIASFSLFFISYQHTMNSVSMQSSVFKFAYEGFKYLKMNSSVLNLIIIAIPFSMLGRFYDIYKVYIADELLQIGPQGIVYFSYAMAIGALVAPVLIKELVKIHGEGSEITVCLKGYMLYLISYMIWGSAVRFSLSLLSLMLVSLGSTIMMISLRTIIQESFEKAYLGRIFSFQKITMILGAILGIVLAPILKEAWGVGLSILAIVLTGIGFITVYYLANNKEVVND